MKVNPEVTKESEVSIRDITKDTCWEICQLSVSDKQKNFVDSAAESMAEANFYDNAWFQGIYADEEPVGFLMLDSRPSERKYIVWRFLIDSRYQGMGFGRTALRLLIAYVQNQEQAAELLTSVVMEEGGPLGFYEKSGFKLTGEYWGREAVMKLELKTNMKDPK
ncbi:MAG: GNAT family N-acetyltransferase [Leptolyngbya sp. SIOISBB]|nr:GNAT family N-acetyltransferase [Leptolyngbya sp. SIOISBB]